MRCLFLFALLPFASFAQDTAIARIFPVKDGRVYYEKVVTVDSSTKDQLYTKAKTWALQHYNSQKDAAQTDDRELGMLVYRGWFSDSYQSPKVMGISAPVELKYWHTLKLFIKENKARLVLDDVEVSSTGVDKIDIEQYVPYLQKAWGKKAKSMNGYVTGTHESYEVADRKFISILMQLEEALKASKSEFDF